MPRDLDQPLVEQRRVTAELVDEERDDPVAVGRGQDGMGADELRDHAAPVDVARQHDGHIGGFGKAHVGDVARPQVHLRRAARPFDQNEIHIGAQTLKAVQHAGHQVALHPPVIARLDGGKTLPLHDHLRPGVGLGLQEHGVHVDHRIAARGPCLQGLRPPDLPPVDGDGGVVRHVLRLERRDRHAAPDRSACQTRDEHRLAHVRARALDHDRLCHTPG